MSSKPDSTDPNGFLLLLQMLLLLQAEAGLKSCDIDFDFGCAEEEEEAAVEDAFDEAMEDLVIAGAAHPLVSEDSASLQKLVRDEVIKAESSSISQNSSCFR